MATAHSSRARSASHFASRAKGTSTRASVLASRKISRSAPRRGGVNFNGRIDDLHVYPRTLERSEIALLAGGPDLAIAAIPAAKRMPEQTAKLRKLYRETQTTEFITAQADLEQAKKTRAELEKKLPNTMVMEEMAA